MVRTFVAVEVPGVVREALADAREALADLDDRVRWVRPEGIHLTLKFLGDVEEVRAPEVVEAVRNLTVTVAPFTLCTGEVGGGPAVDRARVVWVGVGGAVEELLRLQEKVEDAAESLGFARQRRKFYPHLTLGRARRRPVRLPKGVSGRVQPVHFRVERVAVIKSELRPDGAVYSALGYGFLGG